MAESFSKQVKTELCSLPVIRSCCAHAELYGMLLLSNTFSSREIRLLTASTPVALRFCELLQKSGYEAFEKAVQKDGKQLISITDPLILERVFEAYGYDPVHQISLHLNGWVIERDCCRQAFLRGAFLAGGFITDPEKQYRLELVTPHSALAREISALLVDCELPPKITRRQGNLVLYYKESGHIEDFLTVVGAHSGTMRFMEAKLVKDVRNKINRQVNCEASNIFRTVETGQAQADDINYLKQAGFFDDLPDELRETAELRLGNPNVSLTELAKLTEPRISRSGLNRRLQKISRFALERKQSAKKEA